MKAIIGLLGLVTILVAGGCVVEPAYPSAGVSVGVYGEYPSTYYGHGDYYGHRRWYHPYDRDHYYYRPYTYRTW
jgi:hypothetical protein